MVGLERSMLPLVGERDFDLASKSAILSFVVAFGIAKALATWPPAASPTVSGASACWSSAGCSPCPCRS